MRISIPGYYKGMFSQLENLLQKIFLIPALDSLAIHHLMDIKFADEVVGGQVLRYHLGHFFFLHSLPDSKCSLPSFRRLAFLVGSLLVTDLLILVGSLLLLRLGSASFDFLRPLWTSKSCCFPLNFSLDWLPCVPECWWLTNFG